MTETTTWYNQQVAALTPGTVLNGKYELIKQVGRGGMGVVWKAHDRVADRLVALKFVPNDLARFDTEIKRLRESFQKVHPLQHPSICPLYSLEDGGNLGYYHVMKYLEGETLDNYVTRRDPQRQGLPFSQVVAILSRVAAALDYAHSHGVIHRDIKPSNIFLSKANDKIYVQVIDFGLADEIREGMIRTSQTQIEVSGTRPYMSPEQWRSETQTAAADQYALAVVAYELLSGQVPFSANDVTALRLAVMHDVPKQIFTISDTVLQKAANAALYKALAKNAVDRFGTCNEFITALSGKYTGVSEEELPSASSPILRRNWLLAAGIFLVTVIGGIVWGIGGRRKPESLIAVPTEEVPTIQKEVGLQYRYELSKVENQGLQDYAKWELIGGEKRLVQIDANEKGLVGALDLSDCTELKWLECNKNQLVGLNVSESTALTHLQCMGNRFAELDVSTNTALKGMNCGRNPLKKLDLSANTALRWLVCADTPITKLDISTNTVLEELACHKNQLMELDVSKNTALTYLCCHTNRLTELDVSKNTAIKRELNVGNNLLTRLDVSKNTELLWLICTNNQLAELDVSKNTALQMLYCRDNYLTFSTLPVPGTIARYLYAPQKDVIVAETLAAGATLDLSAVGAETYSWHYADDSVVDSSCYTETNGKFVFTGLQDGDAVYCKMTNEKFPDLTLQTTAVTVTAPTR